MMSAIRAQFQTNKNIVTKPYTFYELKRKVDSVLIEAYHRGHQVSIQVLPFIILDVHRIRDHLHLLKYKTTLSEKGWLTIKWGERYQAGQQEIN